MRYTSDADDWVSPWEVATAEPEPSPPPGTHWRRELPRWLASLNPGRTPREYEKAVGYFFATPGVPQELEALSFDLLLAYRGALALRATPHSAATARRTPPRRALPAPAQAALPGDGAPPEDAAEDPPLDAEAPTPLAPATANIRITALRQFLLACAMSGALPQLTPDRIRAALRRLQVERRRPYQVLAEPEWAQFLEAARHPGAGSAPTGTRRILTGARTAPRDHALLTLALATGLRAIELAALDVGDLTREWRAGREEWWLVLPDAKTKGQHGGRTIPLAPEVAETLRTYVEGTGRSWDRPADRTSPLFLSDRRGDAQLGVEPRLSTAQIRRIVDRVEADWRARRGIAGAEAGARAISPHALRHSTALALLEGNETSGRPPASVEHVRGWLGHFDIRTTQGYLAHLDARRHRRPFALAPGEATSDQQEHME